MCSFWSPGQSALPCLYIVTLHNPPMTSCCPRAAVWEERLYLRRPETLPPPPVCTQVSGKCYLANTCTYSSLSSTFYFAFTSGEKVTVPFTSPAFIFSPKPGLVYFFFIHFICSALNGSCLWLFWLFISYIWSFTPHFLYFCCSAPETGQRVGPDVRE